MAKDKEKVLLRNDNGAGVYLNRDDVDRFLEQHPDYAEAAEAKAVESAPENKAVKRSAKKTDGKE